MEQCKISREKTKEYKHKTYEEMKDILDDCWNPAETHKIWR